MVKIRCEVDFDRDDAGVRRRPKAIKLHANYRVFCRARSNADFINKLSIVEEKI